MPNVILPGPLHLRMWMGSADVHQGNEMTLIRVKNYKALDMYSLVRFVLRFIYERKKMHPAEIDFMWESVKSWQNHLDLKIARDEMGAVDIEAQEVLLRLLELLDLDAKGQMEGRKSLCKKHNIDYRRLAFHRLPEAYTREDFKKAAAMKKEYDRAHPEQEGLK